MPACGRLTYHSKHTPHPSPSSALLHRRDRCGARWHFGKAGLNEVVVKNEGCFDGTKDYPQTWCHFGCAVQVRSRLGGCLGVRWFRAGSTCSTSGNRQHPCAGRSVGSLPLPSNRTARTSPATRASPPLPPAALPQELDPAGKFSGAGKGARNIWQWSATRAGQAVPFASCCGPQGFSTECQCARRASCS